MTIHRIWGSQPCQTKHFLRMVHPVKQHQLQIPETNLSLPIKATSGKHLHTYGITYLLMGKPTITGHFQQLCHKLAHNT